MSNYQGGVQNRRKRALKRLQDQLKSDDMSHIAESTTILRPRDRDRIEKEIEILEKRI